MAVNKNFVVKNGIEVNTNLLLADSATKRVGIGSTIPKYKLDVVGGIGVTDINAVGIVTVAKAFDVGVGGTIFRIGASSSIGISTSQPAYLLDVRSPVSVGQTALYVQGDVQITGNLNVNSDISLDEINVRNINATGISSFNNLRSTGVTTIFTGIITSLSGTIGTITRLDSTNLTGTIGTITRLNSTNISVGVITATTLNASTVSITGAAVTDFTVTRGFLSSGISTLGVTTFTGNVSFGTSAYFGDNDRIILGDGNDLQILHDGNHSIIQDVGTGNLYILASNQLALQSATAENYLVGNSNGSVELYFDNSKEFETTGYGATVYGVLESQGLNITGVSTISVNSTNNALRINQTGTGNALLVEDSTNPDATPFVVDASGNVGLGTVTPSAILDIRGNPWFSPNVTGVKATALRLGRFTDGSNAAYDIITDDAVGDSIEIQSNRFTGQLRFSRGSSLGIQTTFIVDSHFANGTSVSISDTTGNSVKIQLNEAGNTYFANTGSVLVGTASSTNTANQKLQVSGSAYVSENVGIATTNPTSRLHVVGDATITGITTGTFRGSAQIGIQTESTVNNSKTYVGLTSTLSFLGIGITVSHVTGPSGITTLTFLAGAGGGGGTGAIGILSNGVRIGVAKTITELNIVGTAITMEPIGLGDTVAIYINTPRSMTVGVRVGAAVTFALVGIGFTVEQRVGFSTVDVNT